MRHRPHHATNLYAASLDWWVAALGLTLVLACLAAIPLLASAHLAAWAVLFGGFILFVFVLTLIDTLFFTRYQLTDDALVVASQLRHYVIPYAQICRVQVGGARGLLTGGGLKRFALSSRCYYLELQGAPWRRISLSPRAADAFLSRLARNAGV